MTYRERPRRQAVAPRAEKYLSRKIVLGLFFAFASGCSLDAAPTLDVSSSDEMVERMVSPDEKIAAIVERHITHISIGGSVTEQPPVYALKFVVDGKKEPKFSTLTGGGFYGIPKDAPLSEYLKFDWRTDRYFLIEYCGVDTTNFVLVSRMPNDRDFVEIGLVKMPDCNKKPPELQ